MVIDIFHPFWKKKLSKSSKRKTWKRLEILFNANYARSHMYLPVVEAADVRQTLVHSAVDGGLCSFPGIFDQREKATDYHPLPQRTGREEMAA